MYKYEIAKRIEEFAPLGTQEDWDCSGWIVNIEGYDDIRKVMLCLTVTDDVIKQAKLQNCDMIISHHPMFCINCHSELVSESYTPKINVYCAHTNLDKAKGGTTDTLVNITLNLIQGLYKDQKTQMPDYLTGIPTDVCLNKNFQILKRVQNDDFLRMVQIKDSISVQDFSKIIKKISPNSRLVNNKNIKELKKIAFCAGSGSEFIEDAKELGADCLVTGDLKFHRALDSKIVLYDIGHFESEVLVLPVFERIIGSGVEVIYAQEKSPFIQI